MACHHKAQSMALSWRSPHESLQILRELAQRPPPALKVLCKPEPPTGPLYLSMNCTFLLFLKNVEKEKKNLISCL
jgi:hypothetical protein